MSQVLINQYLGELDRLKKVGGTHRKSVVRKAFKDLLKGWGRQHDLTFIPEYKLDGANKDTRFVDGALLHELRVLLGYWEAKDAKDDLDDEIAFKFKRGYRFADHKERVIDRLARVTTVSVETMQIVDAMRETKR
jgi:hypothetical protein